MTHPHPRRATVLLALLYLPRLRKVPRPAGGRAEPERMRRLTVLPNPDPERSRRGGPSW